HLLGALGSRLPLSFSARGRWGVAGPPPPPPPLHDGGGVGERARPKSRRDGGDPVRRPADRDHDRPSAGADRHGAGGDRLMATPESTAKPEPKPLLELAGVSMSFGGLLVIDNLDIVVNEREVVSVIGPNGAGKTTLFNLITGIYSPDAGEIRLDGENLVGMPPHKIARRGAARTFQTLRLFLNMSVIENVMASQYGQTKVGVARAML